MLKYGLRSKTLQQARQSVEKLLGLTFELRESSFFGGDYLRAEVGEGTIYVQPNFDMLDNEPFEPSWPSNHFLLCFDGLEDEKWERYIEHLATLESSNDLVFLKRTTS